MSPNPKSCGNFRSTLVPWLHAPRVLGLRSSILWMLGLSIVLSSNVLRAVANEDKPPSPLPQLKFSSSQSAGRGSASIELNGRDSRWQLVVTKAAGNQGTHDVTRHVTYSVKPEGKLAISESGLLTPLADGEAIITAVQSGAQSAHLRVRIVTMEEIRPVNFPNQVVPIFTKYGCNGGGCHGKAAGQAGFKLSLLGFNPLEDYSHLIHESRGRRVFPAMPSYSLLLQKAVGAVPHGGGQRLAVDSHEYRILRRWIAGGMPYGSADSPRLINIRMAPPKRQLERETQQQLQVVAEYSDGSVEDVTHSAQYESNNSDLADVDERGLVTTGKQVGGAAVMARYQGQVAVFRAEIPLGIEVAQWPASRNPIDDWVFGKLRSLGIPPSDLCSDSTWIRRVTLDLAGRLPTAREARDFLASDAPLKFERTVDRLLDSADYATHFAKKWSAILRNRRSNPGQQFRTYAFHEWLRNSLRENQPYDQMVREILTASGNVETNPAVAWFAQVPSKEERIEDAAQLFLGQRLQCARCHHHPYEKWSQRDYYQMAAFFSSVRAKPTDLPDEKRFIAQPTNASAKHPKTGKSLVPAGLDSEPVPISFDTDPRHALADWMVSPENPFFARALANRYWKHFFAIGVVEPEDDMRVTNPASNRELLDGLAERFVESHFDLKSLCRLICTSTAYRLDANANEYNLQDNNGYSRYYPKRLSAEVLLDAIDQVASTHTQFAEVPDGTRANALPDTSFPSYFLDVFGKPDSTTACECERSGDITLAQSLHLLNSKDVQSKLRSDTGRAAAMAASSEPNSVLISQLYLVAFSRQPTAEELRTAEEFLSRKSDKRREAFEDLIWAIINTKEFLFNH